MKTNMSVRVSLEHKMGLFTKAKIFSSEVIKKTFRALFAIKLNDFFFKYWCRNC